MCIAELAIAILGYEVKFIIKPHQMVDNSFAVMNLLFILWCPLSPNSSTGSLFDPRGSGRQEQFPTQRPLWISWTSRRRRRIVSIEMATSAWQAGLNYQPRCSPLLTTNLICIKSQLTNILQIQITIFFTFSLLNSDPQLHDDEYDLTKNVLNEPKCARRWHVCDVQRVDIVVHLLRSARGCHVQCFRCASGCRPANPLEVRSVWCSRGLMSTRHKIWICPFVIGQLRRVLWPLGLHRCQRKQWCSHFPSVSPRKRTSDFREFFF